MITEAHLNEGISLLEHQVKSMSLELTQKREPFVSGVIVNGSLISLEYLTEKLYNIKLILQKMKYDKDTDGIYAVYLREKKITKMNIEEVLDIANNKDAEDVLFYQDKIQALAMLNSEDCYDSEN